MKTLILKPKFIDRAGRTVYDVHERAEERRYMMPGAFVGQLRMKPNEDKAVEIEWTEPQAKQGIDGLSIEL
jgi:hypothetical protein